jgi:hypothetical protein
VHSCAPVVFFSFPAQLCTNQFPFFPSLPSWDFGSSPVEKNWRRE